MGDRTRRIYYQLVDALQPFYKDKVNVNTIIVCFLNYLDG